MHSPIFEHATDHYRYTTRSEIAYRYQTVEQVLFMSPCCGDYLEVHRGRVEIVLTI